MEWWWRSNPTNYRKGDKSLIGQWPFLLARICRDPCSLARYTYHRKGTLGSSEDDGDANDEEVPVPG